MMVDTPLSSSGTRFRSHASVNRSALSDFSESVGNTLRSSIAIFLSLEARVYTGGRYKHVLSLVLLNP